MKNRSRLARALAAFLLLLASLVEFSTPVQAAVGNILPPFNTGETWYIYQGYGPNAFSHHNNPGNPPSLYGLDLTVGNSSTAAAGKNVHAPISGTATYSAGSGTLCINTPGNGRSLALTHINSSVPNGPVTAGQIVGTVAAADQKQNGGVAHIHLQTWSTNGCWGTGNGGMPFDAAHGSRICGAPDLTPSGGGGTNGVWSGTSFKGESCTTAPENRSAITIARNADGRLELFAVGGDGNIYSKSQVAANNSFGWSWNTISAGAQDVAAAASIDGRIELFHVGNDGAVWQRAQACPNCSFGTQQSLGGNVKPAITAARNADGRLEVFVIGGDNNIYAKSQTSANGSFSSNWNMLTANARDIASAVSIDGRIELFYIANDSTVRHRAQVEPNGSFGAETNFGGGLGGSLTAERNADGRLEVFAVGGNGHIYSKAQLFPNGTFSQAWNEIPAGIRDIAAGVSVDGRIELVHIGNDRATYHRAQTCPNCSFGSETYLGGGLM